MDRFPHKMENYYFKHPGHFADMFTIFEELYRSKALSDVTIACDGKTIDAHRIVLSAGSDYFRRILVNLAKQKSSSPIIMITDISYEDMEIILEFIYRGQIVVPQDKVESLRQAAFKLRIKGFENFLKNPFPNNGMIMGNQYNNKISKGNVCMRSMLNRENKRAHMNDGSEKRMRLMNEYSRKLIENPELYNRFQAFANKEKMPGQHEMNGLPKNFHFTPNNGFAKKGHNGPSFKRQPIVPPVQPLKININEMSIKPESDVRTFTPILSRHISPKGDVPTNDSHDENDDNNRNENVENNSIDHKMHANNGNEEAINLSNGHGKNSQNVSAQNAEEYDSDDDQEVNYTYEMDPTALNWETNYNDENVPENPDESGESYEDEDEDTFENIYRNGNPFGVMMNQVNLMNLAGQLKRHQLENGNGGSQIIYCEHCSKTFVDEDHLQLHNKRTHGLNKLNECNICGKTYAWKSGLYKHKRHVHNIVSSKSLQANDNMMVKAESLSPPSYNGGLTSPGLPQIPSPAMAMMEQQPMMMATAESHSPPMMQSLANLNAGIASPCYPQMPSPAVAKPTIAAQ